MNEERSKEFAVFFGTGVADVIRKAQRMVDEAKAWAQIAWADDLEVDINNANQWREKYTEVQLWVREMEVSFYRCLLHLITLASQTGELKLSWDSENSLFFLEPSSGYHGGFIYHAKYADGEKRLPVGEWSLHT